MLYVILAEDIADKGFPEIGKVMAKKAGKAAKKKGQDERVKYPRIDERAAENFLSLQEYSLSNGLKKTRQECLLAKAGLNVPTGAFIT